MMEHRNVHGGLVRASGVPGTVVARVMRYGVVDEYDTIFDPGCFADSLRERLPVFAWAHSWSEPIGRATRLVRDDQVLELEFRLDVGSTVPRADQAYAQLQSGTLDEFSVGFRRMVGGSYQDEDGRTHFTRATLDEVSVVLAGAVPGTELLSVRSRVDAALGRPSRPVEGRDHAGEHRDYLRRQYLGGRLTRAQYLDDLRAALDADEALEHLGMA